MDSSLAANTGLAIIRAIHIGSCLLLLGIWLFESCVGMDSIRFDRPLLQAWWRAAGWTIAVCEIAAFVSGAEWFAMVVIDMSGLSLRQAVASGAMGVVWSQTRFGRLWALRTLLFLLGAFASTITLKSSALWRPLSRFASIALNALLVGSLAWSGHGGTGRWPAAHRTADVIHLLAASLWPAGLVPLLVVLSLAISCPRSGARAILGRFSRMSATAVVLLGASGIASTLCLAPSWSSVVSSAYGRLLAMKVLCFLFMVAVGAVNLMILRPRIERSAMADDWHARQLRASVAVEVALAIIVLLIVGVMGLLPPGG